MARTNALCYPRHWDGVEQLDDSRAWRVLGYDFTRRDAGKIAEA
jgi:hypothetical protein